MRLTTKIISGFVTILILVVILTFYVISSINTYEEIHQEQEERHAQVGLSKNINQLNTDIALVAMDSIIDRDNGDISSDRLSEINKLFKEFHSMKANFISAADTNMERKKITKIINALEKIEPIIKNDLRKLIKSNAKKSEFKKLDDKIDLIAGDIDSDIHKVIDSIKEEQQEANEKMQSYSKSIIRNIIIVALIVFMIVLIISFLTSKSMLSRVKVMQKGMREIITSKDLTKKVPDSVRDEIGDIIRDFNSFMNTLKDLILDMQNTSNETASVANELSSTGNQVGERVENEANIIEGNVKSAGEMQTLIDSSVNKATSTKNNILMATDNLDSVRSEILSMVTKIQHTSEIEIELSAKLNQLSSDAEQVKGVLTVISDIADQTNLLALNAAIEAARAGEHGRGFAVVADEVRQLAERTQKSLNEINTTISVIVQAIVDASENMNKNSKTINELSNVSNEVENKINETSSIMNQSVNIANEALNESTDIANKLTQRMKNTHKMSELSTSNARSVEEMATAIEHLHRMTEELNTKANQFKT